MVCVTSTLLLQFQLECSISDTRHDRNIGTLSLHELIGNEFLLTQGQQVTNETPFCPDPQLQWPSCNPLSYFFLPGKLTLLVAAIISIILSCCWCCCCKIMSDGCCACASLECKVIKKRIDRQIEELYFS